jgi:hypothetical protein
MLIVGDLTLITEGNPMGTFYVDDHLYRPEDQEIIDTLGSREKQAQMRHHGRAPAYYRLGRKIIYHGRDLNQWANAQRIEQVL